MPLNTDPTSRVTDALMSRITCRAYLDKAVPEDVLKRIFKAAQRSPSGGNLQPWNVHVLTGGKLKAFVGDVMGKAMSMRVEKETHPAYPSPLWEPHRSWRYKLGEDMYALLGIEKDDKPARIMQVAENFKFFGAPVGVVITTDKRMNAPQYMDIGIYLQSLMLLAREEGLHTAPQGAWRNWPDTARDHLDFPDEQEVLVGLSLGYGDADAPVNDLYSDRAALADLVHFYS